MTNTSPSIQASVFIITKNEARHLAAVLQSVQDFDEVILVDSGSTDETLNIAKQYGAKVYHQEWLGFAKQKAYAMSLCQHSWVLNLDGDEILPKEALSSIRKALDKHTAYVYRLHFEDIFWQAPMSPYSKKRSIVRFYRQDAVQFPVHKHVHENVILNAGENVKSLDGLVTHYGYATTEQLMTKQNTYSSLRALEKHEAGKRASLIKLMLVFPITFIKTYFFRKMFLSGKRGFIHAMIDAMYAFLKEAKLFEFNQTKK